ncbi:helix-turn-helix domain-containing protein [Streptomyces sp. NPDC014748]|uniref:helix-turn-helix domain-containing protein n=1 Tax=Streptomyces sp. NPDC014748 TaxID=3364905 RepID=UPI0036FE0677
MSDTAPAPAEKLLPAAEVAEALNVSLTAVYRLVRSGDLPSHRFGKGKVRPRGVRIPESAIEAYLNDSLIAPSEVA